MPRFALLPIFLALLIPPAYADKIKTAEDLTTLLRAGRSVTVSKSKINDPSKYNLNNFEKKAKSYFERDSGKPFDESNVLLVQLMDAMKAVISDAKAGKYKDKWPTGPYANQFLPARFAIESGIRFGEQSNGKASLKLTTSNVLLVNADNKPDDWEASIIENNFQNAEWPKNKTYSENTPNGFRLMLPEYFNAKCLSCHGGNAGKSIHLGKIAGFKNKFGGAISVTLK